jgi:4-diphosphocytidyl-2C-methyl-D-erythritol kinase
MPECHAVLVLSDVGCDTGEVYRRFDACSPIPFEVDRIRQLAQHPLDTQTLFNDLSEPACQAAPALAENREAVANIIAAPVHITGSGSTLFALCTNAAEAEAMASAIEAGTGLSSVVVAAVGPEWGKVQTAGPQAATGLVGAPGVAPAKTSATASEKEAS